MDETIQRATDLGYQDLVEHYGNCIGKNGKIEPDLLRIFQGAITDRKNSENP